MLVDHVVPQNYGYVAVPWRRILGENPENKFFEISAYGPKMTSGR